MFQCTELEVAAWLTYQGLPPRQAEPLPNKRVVFTWLVDGSMEASRLANAFFGDKAHTDAHHGSVARLFAAERACRQLLFACRRSQEVVAFEKRDEVVQRIKALPAGKEEVDGRSW